MAEQTFPTIYLIRHGEKPPKASDGQDPPGLSKVGFQRAQDLVNVFGKDSQYNIGYIIAQKPKGGTNTFFLSTKRVSEMIDNVDSWFVLRR